MSNPLVKEFTDNLIVNEDKSRTRITTSQQVTDFLQQPGIEYVNLLVSNIGWGQFGNGNEIEFETKLILIYREVEEQ